MVIEFNEIIKKHLNGEQINTSDLDLLHTLSEKYSFFKIPNKILLDKSVLGSNPIPSEIMPKNRIENFAEIKINQEKLVKEIINTKFDFNDLIKFNS